MNTVSQPAARRYSTVTEEKAEGATYTPKILADFVAARMLQFASLEKSGAPLRVLDPAVGDGELLVSLLMALRRHTHRKIEIHGFETNATALQDAGARLRKSFPGVSVSIEQRSFLEFVQEHCGKGDLFRPKAARAFDLIIANPPYVRTQIMGARQARQLARQFGLTGRVDLYYPFVMGMAQVLEPRGIAGIIVSNRFMSTKSGEVMRNELRERLALRHVWDLGDTRLFKAAVLPAVIVAEMRNGRAIGDCDFTSIYGTDESSDHRADNAIAALELEGVVEVGERRFRVQHGKLAVDAARASIWRVATATTDAWLATVHRHTWGTFKDIGRIRVGVKTCADDVYIRSDWQDMPVAERPELLRPLTTHHVARRFKAQEPDKRRCILYPHETLNGVRRPVDLERYPRTCAYLKRYRATLEARSYLMEAGRKWFELWVPQDPAAWSAPKLVFRDIAAEPTFWMDLDGSIVNGDCYWLTAGRADAGDLLWLAAAVGNSTFIEIFYDRRFHQKLYAGRRRFMTQRVEQFPLPDPQGEFGPEIIARAKELYRVAEEFDRVHLAAELDRLVWRAFGLTPKEIVR